MKDSILKKLQLIADRHEEVAALLGEPDVISRSKPFP
jgi:protein subunit release factor A